jgi:hypothetical protein
MHKETRLRVWVVLIAALGTAIALSVPLLAWAHLPEPIATHWSLRGSPNGSMPRALALALFGGLAAVPALLSLPRVSKPLGAQGPRLLGVQAFMSSLSVLLSIMIVMVNWDRSHWTQVLLSPAMPLGLLVVPFLVWVLVERLTRRQGIAVEPRAESESSSLELGEGERVFWSGRAENPWLGLAVLGALAVAAVFITRGAWLMAAVHGGIALLLEQFTRIRVTVSGQQLTIFYGHLGWARQRIAVSRIRRASTFDLVPMAHGGWGYRGSLGLWRHAAVVVRRGLALRLELEGGRQLTITIDDAVAGAELVNGLVERARLGAHESGKEGRLASPA